MLRRIRRTVLLLSLALCVGCVALWVRSHFRRDAIVSQWPAHGIAIRSGDGLLRFYVRTTDRGSGVAANAWNVSFVTGGPFTFDDNPFQTGSWTWSTLILQPTPTFEWERVQASTSAATGMTITSAGGGTIMLSGSSGVPSMGGEDYLRITFPYWLPVCVFGVLPALAAVRFAATHWRRYRRLLVGTCPICAYDLRATPGHCPECGWTVSVPREPGAAAAKSTTAGPVTS